jgi:hypothetical protein
MALWLQWLMCGAAGLAALAYLGRHYGWWGRRPSGGCSKCEVSQRMLQQLQEKNKP